MSVVSLEASKGSTWSGKGLPPTERGAIKFSDGTVRLLGKTISLDGSDLEAEKAAARAKLTARERRVLGVDK